MNIEQERAFEQILHSVQQAQIPGNDWRRELKLIESTCRAALQSQTIPASDWFDMFMELARAVVVANRLFAVSPTTTKQKVAADAAIALQEHARKHPALQSQDREDSARLNWLESCEEAHGFCHTGYGEYRYYAHQTKGLPSVREAIDHARRVEG